MPGEKRKSPGFPPCPGQSIKDDMLEMQGNYIPLPYDKQSFVCRAARENITKHLTGKEKKHKVEVPNNDRRSDSLCHSQDDKNNGYFYLSHTSCLCGHVCKLAVSRPVTVRTGGLSLAGERDTAFLRLKS